MDEASSTHGEDEKSVQKFGWKPEGRRRLGTTNRR